MLRHHTNHQSPSRLKGPWFKQQRKLFLLAFLWTSACVLLIRSNLRPGKEEDAEIVGQPHDKLFARSPPASSSAAPIYLGPEFALPDNSNNALYYYSLAAGSQREPQPPPPPHDPSRAQAIQPRAGLIATDGRQQVKSQRSPLDHCKYKRPNLIDLKFNNIHWQVMTNSWREANDTADRPAANFYLYNAYYDDRWRGGLPSVRILAMIDRIQPPATNCLLWSRQLIDQNRAYKPLVVRAEFVYAWYPKWGNYKDGLLQPWIVTCRLPKEHVGLVPDSVTLVEAPTVIHPRQSLGHRHKRQSAADQQTAGSMAMPAPFSSSSFEPPAERQLDLDRIGHELVRGGKTYDCTSATTLTNDLPVHNLRPKEKGKFTVCVKGLDFPNEDVSIRLVEWIELLNLLGADKIFLYTLDVHENISKVLHYYKQRGMVELNPLTLPGDQPNLPDYQHQYLKSKLTTKRQNELIPYNDCLYRNLHSYQYLALLDIDEIIMPLRHHNWYDLMQEVEKNSLQEQNYSRASYNVRNVYFFDDLAGPLGTTSSESPPSYNSDSADNNSPLSADDTSPSDGNLHDERLKPRPNGDSLERGIPHYLHMMQHVYRSKNYTKPGQYVKCFHNTERVVSLHNHFPMNCFGQCTTYSIPVKLAHLQHYRKDCVGPLKQSCKSDYRVFTTRDTTIWKYKQQMIKRTTRVLNHLNLLSSAKRKKKEV